MATTNSVSNIVIEPVDGLFGAQHRVLALTVADVANSLAGDHFRFSTKDTKFYVWYSHNSAVDPAPAGYTEIEVSTVLSGDSAATVATKTATAINAVAATNKFHAKATDNCLVLEAKLMGAPLEAAAAQTSGFTISVQKLGFTLSLGYLDGDIDLALNEKLVDVVAHQTGSQLLGQLRTGVTAGPIKLTLLESTAASLKAIMEKGIGVENTPSGGSAVTAIGSLAGSKQFGNVTDDGGKLVLHPTKNVETDYSGDFAFWLCYPKLNALKLSGEKAKTIEVEFSIFLDSSKVNEGNIGVYGDHTQNFLK